MVLGWRSQGPIFLEAPSHPFFSSYYLKSRAPLNLPPPSRLLISALLALPSSQPSHPHYLSHLPPSETCRLFFSLSVSSGPRQATDPALQALMP